MEQLEVGELTNHGIEYQLTIPVGGKILHNNEIIIKSHYVT